MNTQRKIVYSIIAVLVLVVITLGSTYAVVFYSKTGETESKVIAGTLKFSYTENTGVGAGISLTNAFPVSDTEGKSYDEEGKVFDFSIEATNTGGDAIPYEVTLRKKSSSTLDQKVVKVYLTDTTNDTEVELLGPTLYSSLAQTGIDVGEETEKTIYSGTVSGKVSNYSKKFRLRIWIDENTDFSGIEQEDGTMVYPYNGKIFIATVNVYTNPNYVYTDAILNGADPVLESGGTTTNIELVPVIINDDGSVIKADVRDKWYSYQDKEWANAIILKDESVVYLNGDTIPESNIESYFVWIPKYSYQIFDLGNYSSLTSIANKEKVINIKFGLTNTDDSVSGECTTPSTAGESGNCEVGEYMTHPAFLAFDSNGFWVGKFETGYDGATSTEGAQQDVVDTSKIIIKPNVYSWRNITVGNIFKNSYDYNRSLDSHAIKNTEWGSVAYLQHSAYGSATSLRFNNNKSLITGYAGTEEPTKGYNTNGTSIAGNRNESTSLGVDGTYTINYLNSSSAVASTTGNYTGIYDMSGGVWEYVMGYTTGATTTGGSSGITSLYSDFFTNSAYTKYWDKYTSTTITNYNNRFLGDATGEMGSFGSQTDPDGTARNKSSWYGDYAHFADSAYPWFKRGGSWHNGTTAGAFAFYFNTGGVYTNDGFRIVLTPTK